MGTLVVPIVMLVILGVFGIVFFVVVKKQNEGIDSKSGKSSTSGKESSSKEKKHEIKKEDVFDFMEFDEISDNMIIQNKGTRYTMMIQCKGINYDLMSDVEQLSVEEGFITFLNTLTSPIQLYVQAQNLDLKGTIKVYKQHVDKIKEEFENVNQEYNRVNEAFDSTKDEISKIEKERNKTLNVYEYASDIVNYVERISLNKSLLQRTFFVLVSYNSSEINAIDRFTKEEVRNICYNELVTRAQSIINGLAGCSVAGRILNSNEIADVLYTAYNRDDKGLMSVKEALDSGFYRLYSTSEDIFLKKQKKLQEEIDNEARIKALETLKESIKEGEYISPRIKQLDIEEQISKKASEIVRRENVPVDIKEKANEKLIQEFRKTKKDILEKAGAEYQELTETLGVDVGLDEDKKDNENTNANEQKNNISSESNVANENIEDSKIKTDAKNADESSKNNLNVEEKSEEDTVHEQRPIVQKIKVDESNFEYNRNLDNKSDNDFDINLSDGFDDRMGSSSLDDATNSSENDSII